MEHRKLWEFGVKSKGAATKTMIALDKIGVQKDLNEKEVK